MKMVTVSQQSFALALFLSFAWGGHWACPGAQCGGPELCEDGQSPAWVPSSASGWAKA